ncbi:hypothetical protein ACFRAI_27840 [Streptomyces sp. NPDC056637]|uniref:hypothetical protein n=1 Tax=Streptomyces sp. NPDC056637 TaxID=3345886 RepID=UPI0036B151DA
MTPPEPYDWTCTCGAAQSFPAKRGVFPTAWRHTHPTRLDQLRQLGRRPVPHPHHPLRSHPFPNVIF